MKNLSDRVRNSASKLRSAAAARGLLRPAGEKVEDHADRYLPEIQKRSRRRRRRWLGLGIFCVLFVLCVGSAAALLYMPIFQVREFKLVGNVETSQEEIFLFLRGEVLRSGWWQEFLGFSNILAWPSQVPDTVLNSFPGLEEITIEKGMWRRSITVTVKERKAFGTWCLTAEEPPRCFWFDQLGVLAARAPYVEGRLILRVDDRSKNPLAIGSTILPAGQVENAFSVFQVLKESGVDVESIMLQDANLQELHVSLAGGPKLYFSVRFSAENTIAVLESLQGKTTDLAGIQYIDFRVENRAYYK